MEQGGVYKVTLYENKDISLNYPDISDHTTINSVSNTGDLIEIDNGFDTPTLDFENINADNNELGNVYELSYNLNLLQQETIDNIENVMTSIYGWCPLVEYYNGNKFFLRTPLFFEEISELNMQESHNFVITLKQKVLTYDELLIFSG